MNVQKLGIINGNNNFPDYKLKCFSKKYVDSIRSTLIPNPNNRPNILYLEQTIYCNETEKFQISSEVEEIKKTE